jgi:phosphatidylserine decarboxylase
MTLHREGFSIIFYTLLALVGLNGLLEYVAPGAWYTTAIEVLSLIFFVLIVQFFRNPSRTTPNDDNAIIAPADGKVVVIEEVEETEYIKGKCRLISIFM